MDMTVPIAALALVAATAAAPPRDTPLSAAELKAHPGARGQPADVQRFIVRYDDCGHWAGEEPYDADRKREIDAAIAQTCKGNDAIAARLRQRYAKNPTIQAVLRGYPDIGL
jgi:hypothetical protein